MGALSITGQTAKREAFAPLLGQVSFAFLNNSLSLRAAALADTGLIIMEPIQGEGGVHPAEAEFLRAARSLADELGALLCFDEVQTGVGRTGSFFAFERVGVRPDLVTLAKGLANGLPIGALLVADNAIRGFEPGDHASTFGGNPVACAAACAVLDAIDEELLTNVSTMGERLATGLRELPAVRDVRGAGLLIGAEVEGSAAEVAAAALERKLLVTTCGASAIRLTPPLTVSASLVDQALATLKEVLA
jgi:acetylornithine/succinyldiaminopimelate/putrescine aminotransferase